jgi:hypothetical protein
MPTLVAAAGERAGREGDKMAGRVDTYSSQVVQYFGVDKDRYS